MPFETCPQCHGGGRVATEIRLSSGTRAGPSATCPTCDGYGTARMERVEMYQRGQACAEARRARGEGERQAARRLGISIAHLAAMEAGRIDPAPLEAELVR